MYFYLEKFSTFSKYTLNNRSGTVYMYLEMRCYSILIMIFSMS